MFKFLTNTFFSLYLQKLRCRRKEPCRLFTARKRPKVEEVTTNTLCQCGVGYTCPNNHRHSSVLLGTSYPLDNIKTYSGYCHPDPSALPIQDEEETGEGVTETLPHHNHHHHTHHHKDDDTIKSLLRWWWSDQEAFKNLNKFFFLGWRKSFKFFFESVNSLPNSTRSQNAIIIFFSAIFSITHLSLNFFKFLFSLFLFCHSLTLSLPFVLAFPHLDADISVLLENGFTWANTQQSSNYYWKKNLPFSLSFVY